MKDSSYGELIRLGDTNTYLQVGKSAFSGAYTDSTEIPVRTNLKNITAGKAYVYDTYSPATDANALNYVLFVDLAVSNGAVNVYRSSQGMVSGLPFCYELIGNIDATD